MAASLADYTQIVRLYVSVLDRVPDSAGLKYWADALADGMPLENIVRDFLQTPEAQATYPDNASTDDFVASFYQAVFNREPDAAGLQFWTDALWANGGIASYEARAFIVSALIDAVSTPVPSRPEGMTQDDYAQTLIDRAVFANKVEVGLFFGLERDTTFEQTPGILDIVDETRASVNAAKAWGEETPEPNPNPNPVIPDTVIVAGKTYTLAEIEALPHGRLAGTAGEDTLLLTDVTHTPGASITRGIENIVLSNVATEAVIDVGQSFVGSQFVSVGRDELLDPDSEPEDLFAAIFGGFLTGMAGKTLGVRGSLDMSTVDALNFNLSSPDMDLIRHLTVVLADVGNVQTDMSVQIDDAFAVVVPVGEQVEQLNLSGNGVALIPLGLAQNMPEVPEESLPPGFPFPSIPSFADIERIVLTVQEDERLILLSMLAPSGDEPSTSVHIDASANNGDVQTVVMGGMSYTGGAGRDVVAVMSEAVGLLDGGAGDEDALLVMTHALSFNEIEHDGFEVLSVAYGNGGDYDAAGFQVLRIADGAGDGVAFTNVALGTSLEIGSSSGSIVSLALADSSANDDELDVTLDEDPGIVSLVANGIEVLNVQSNVTAENAVLMLNMDEVDSVIVTGTGSFTLHNVDAPTLRSVDAGALTSDFAFTVASQIDVPGQSLTVKGSATGKNTLSTGNTNDELTGGSGNDSFFAGAGDDTLIGKGGRDEMTGGIGADTFVPGASATRNDYTTILDFEAADRISLDDLIAPDADQGLSVFRLDAGTVPNASLDLLIEEMIQVTNTPGRAAVGWFWFEGNTWVVVNNPADSNEFEEGRDQLIHLVGEHMMRLDDDSFLIGAPPL